MQKGLFYSEWVLTLTLLCVMASFAVIAKVKALHCSEILVTPPPLVHEMCEVTIEGAVKKPGIFQALPGTSLKTILKKSGLQANSDLRQLDLTQRIERSMQIQIPELAELNIIFEKSGETIHRTVPVGTKVAQLKSLKICSPQIAKKIFRSRRLVRDGEVFRLDNTDVVSLEEGASQSP